MIRAALCFLAIAIPSAAAAQASDWQGGVFSGDPADLFNGQPAALSAFVKAHHDLATDAAIHLSPCAGDDTDNLCHLNQDRFILDYIAAFYDDHVSQSNVGYFLSGDGMPPNLVGQGNMQIGVSPDPAWGCAWRIATLTSGASYVGINDLSDYKNDCEQLPQSTQNQALSIASGVLVPQIHDVMGLGTIPYDLVDDYPGSP